MGAENRKPSFYRGYQAVNLSEKISVHVLLWSQISQVSHTSAIPMTPVVLKVWSPKHHYRYHVGTH